MALDRQPIKKKVLLETDLLLMVKLLSNKILVLVVNLRGRASSIVAVKIPLLTPHNDNKFCKWQWN